MFGGIAIRNRLLCHGYSDSRGRIRLLDLATGKVKATWGFGAESGGWSDVGGLCLDRDANIFVADPEGGMIRRFSVFGNPAGQPLGPPAGEEVRLYRDRKGAVDHPNDLALDDRGNLYVCCGDRPLRHGVQCFAPDGTFRHSFRSFGEPLEEWGIPMGLALAGDRLYVADTFNRCIQVFALDGGFRMMFSTAHTKETISQPVAVAVRRNGDVLVAQWKDRPAVLAFNSSGWFLGELVGPGRQEGRVQGPASLALDEEENIFVLDKSGERIQQFDPGGRFVRVVWDSSGGE